MVIFVWFDRYFEEKKARGVSWTLREVSQTFFHYNPPNGCSDETQEYRRLPLACAGGPLLAISQFWLVSVNAIIELMPKWLTSLIAARAGLLEAISTGSYRCYRVFLTE